MSLRASPRGSLRPIGVRPTRTDKNGGKKSRRHKRPVQNKSEPAFPSPTIYNPHRPSQRGVGLAGASANRKRSIFFVKYVHIFCRDEPVNSATHVLTRAGSCRS